MPRGARECNGAAFLFDDRLRMTLGRALPILLNCREAGRSAQFGIRVRLSLNSEIRKQTHSLEAWREDQEEMTGSNFGEVGDCQAKMCPVKGFWFSDHPNSAIDEEPIVFRRGPRWLRR